MAGKRNFQLTEEQIQELKTACKASANGETRTRLQAVRLYGTGYPVQEITEIADCTPRSLLRWCRKYGDQGIAGLEDQRRGGNQAKLSAVQVEDVAAKLRQYRPVDVLGPAEVATANGQHWTIPDLKQALQQWHGVVYESNTSYRRLFHHCGFSYQRATKAFRSRSAAQVATFEEQLEKN